MKIIKFFIYINCLLLTIPSVSGRIVTNYTTYYTPIYMSHEKFYNSFEVKSGTEINNLGKLYLWKNYIFLNEKNKGIHIIDNRNPKALKQKYFINIPGNFDMAIKDGILYADSCMDLLIIDVNNIDKIQLIKRKKSMLKYDPLKYIEYINDNHSGHFTQVEKIDKTKGIVIDWKIKIKKSYQVVPWGAKFSNEGNSGTGKAGSMTRFLIYNNYLYIVDESKFNVFKINSKNELLFHKMVEIEKIRNEIIETIFYHDNYLFIGSTAGIYIYSIKKDPSNPVYISKLEHIFSWDPVVVEGKYAYVTLFNGDFYIINIANIKNPKIINRQYIRYKLRGLAVENSIAFICSYQGLEIYNVKNPEKIESINLINNNFAYDVILKNNLLYLITEKGLHIYNYSNIQNLILLDSIEINK